MFFLPRMRYSVGSNYYRSNVTSPFDSPTSTYVIYQISSHLVHKQGHYGNIFNFWRIWKKVWGRVINPLWCLKAPSPATKKWIFEFYTKFGFRNHLQTFWPRRLVKSELSLGLHTFYLRIAKMFRFFPCRSKQYASYMELQLTTTTNDIFGILHLKTVVKCMRFIIFWY